MSRFWSPDVRELTPYVPGEQPRIEGLIKLNTNENPYPPSAAALAAIRAAADDSLRLYPDPDALSLKQAIAESFPGVELSADQVFVGNGSDEVLGLAFYALLRHERPILLPDISYSFYPVYCRLFGIHSVTIPLAADFQIRVEDYRRPNGGVVVANPNAPTGSALPLATIEQLLADHPDSVVIVDEAYVDFGAETAVGLVARHPNLLVVQTLSKSRALAGLRVGFAMGDANLIAGLERVKNSFNSYPLDRMAIAGAVAAMRDREHFDRTRLAVMKSRDELVGALRTIGFEVLPSAANFVFARHPRWEGAALAAALRERRILVRHFARPRIGDYLRITVGTDEQCARLLQAIAQIIGDRPA